jgi:hypothetical protein
VIDQSVFPAKVMDYDLVFQGLEADAVISFIRIGRL